MTPASKRELLERIDELRAAVERDEVEAIHGVTMKGETMHVFGAGEPQPASVMLSAPLLLANHVHERFLAALNDDGDDDLALPPIATPSRAGN